jgi:hypothetical protein
MSKPEFAGMSKNSPAPKFFLSVSPDEHVTLLHNGQLLSIIRSPREVEERLKFS